MNITTPTVLLIAAISSLAPLRAIDVPKREAPANPPVRAEKPVTLAAPEAADTALLQGRWEGVEVGKEGKGKCILTVDGNTLRFEGSQKEEWYRASFTLPAGAEPKQLRGTILDCPVPDMVGQVSTGIYKLDQGKLTLAGHRPGSGITPKSFEPEPGARIFVFSKAEEPAK